jgi:hypothetical protein
MNLRDGLLVLLANSIVSLAAVGLYHLYGQDRPIKLGVVDLASVYRDKEAQFSKAVGDEHATDTDRDRAVAAARDFAKTLPNDLASLSQACGCVVLLGNAVASSTAQVKDLTPLLRAKVGI